MKLRVLLKNHAGWQVSLLLTGLFLVVYYRWFFWLEANVVPRYIMHTTLDDILPFCPYFVLPYIAWFPFIYGVLFYFFLFSPADFKRTGILLAAGQIVCLIIYTLFPNGQDLRPVIAADSGLFNDIVAWIYASDTPTNVCPSIHVLGTIIIQAGIFHCKRLAGRHWLKIGTTLLSLSIIMSTMLIKQHSVIDVGAAIVLAATLYIPAYVLPKIRDYTKDRKKGT